MNDIEKLMSQYPNLSFKFEKVPFGLGGLIVEDEVTINSQKSAKEQLQWLYEELGHYFTSTGDIADYSKEQNMKQEKVARTWGMQHQVSKAKLKKLSYESVDDDFEIADELGVKVDYLHEVGTTYGFRYKALPY